MSLADEFRSQIGAYHGSKPSKQVTHVYHYTNFVTLQEIFTNKEIWVNDTTFMNDRMEVKEFASMSVQAFSEMIFGSDLRAHPRNRGGHWLIEYFRTALQSLCARPSYVASFSAEKSLLSQWRAYCPKGGVSIGFPLDALRMVAQAQGLFCTWCEYETPKITPKFLPYTDLQLLPLAKMWVHLYEGVWALPIMADDIASHRSQRDVIASLAHYGNDITLERKRYIDTNEIFLSRLADHCRQLSPIFKNRSFKEEAEFRLYANEIDADRLSVRAAESSLVRYLSLNLSSLFERYGDDLKIVLGPCDPDYRDSLIRSVQNVVWDRYPKVEIEDSNIPLRF